MAEIENVKSKRELLNERMKGKYPDMDFSDDEVSSLETPKEEEKETNMFRQLFMESFEQADEEDESERYIGWSEGADPAVELVRQFGTDIKEAIDDPERQEAIAAANKEYLERVAKEKELEETYQANLAESLKNIDELQAKHGLTDEQVDEAMALVLQIANDAVVGKFTPETIEMAMKAINHDVDVDEAALEGEIRGKNTKIEETLKRNEAGDGVAALAGKNNIPPKRAGQSIFDEARGAN